MPCSPAVLKIFRKLMIYRMVSKASWPAEVMVVEGGGGVARMEKWSILAGGERRYSVEKPPSGFRAGGESVMSVQINITMFVGSVWVLLRIYGCFIVFMPRYSALPKGGGAR